jgi:glycosyltransferase involved in cell wall biosynthesis
MSISLLLPSRKRPQIFSRMVKSVKDTATNPVEIVARFDEDDTESAKSAEQDGAIVIVGPRIRKITALWNECFDLCTGDICAQWNDDCVTITPGWDVMVEKAFAEVPDKIMCLYGRDVFGHGDRFGPHSFVSRRWIETLGFFIYPYYESDFGDTGLVELGDRIGRRRCIPFDIEHWHYSYGMCEPDENTLERLARHAENDPDSLYYGPEKTAERERDAKRLAAVMYNPPDTSKWVPPGTPGVLSRGPCQKCKNLATVKVGEELFCNACGYSWKI